MDEIERERLMAELIIARRNIIKSELEGNADTDDYNELKKQEGKLRNRLNEGIEEE